MSPPPTVPTWYLRLNGLEVPVRTPQGSELALERGGEYSRAWDNSVWSNALPSEEKRSWRFTTPGLPWAEWSVLRPLLEDMVELTADGMAIDVSGNPVQVLAQLEDVPNEPENDNVDIRYVATFLLLEV